MQWIEAEVKIKDLKEYNKNPRRITKEQLQKLVNSLQEDGYHQRLIIDYDNTIIGGHARKKALKASGFKDDDVIKVLKPERKLDQEEFNRLNIRDNGAFGSWHMDSLANLGYDFENLIEWGVPSSEFADMFVKEDEGEIKSDVPKQYKIEINFLNQEHRDKAYQQISDLGYQCNLK